MNEWSASAYISIRAFFVLSYAPAAESAPSDWHRQHLQTAPSSPSTAVFHACIFICGWECRWWYMCLGCLPACACQADSTINTWMWFWRVLNNTASNDEARGISLNHYTHGQCWSGKLQCVKRLKCWASMHSLVCPWWWYGGCAHPFWTTLRLLIRCITHTYTERERKTQRQFTEWANVKQMEMLILFFVALLMEWSHCLSLCLLFFAFSRPNK